jgi:hypothetical protein
VGSSCKIAELRDKHRYVKPRSRAK